MKAKGLKISDGSAEKIGEVLSQMIENCSKDWECPWLRKDVMTPKAYMSRKEYNGINAFLLAMLTQARGYKTSLYMTMKNINDLGLKLIKEEIIDEEGNKTMDWAKPFPVFFWNQLYKRDGEFIKEEEYRELSSEEKKEVELRWVLKTYNVWNIDQTTMAEVMPEKYKEKTEGKEKHEETEQDFKNAVLDYEIEGNNWICPINLQTTQNAYYSISKDEIVMPRRELFKSASRFYGTALHEMTHSTLKPLKRDCTGSFGSQNYAREELIAELTSAIVMNDLGCEKYMKEDSIPYAKSWMKQVKDKDVLKVIMDDIMRAVAYQKKEYEKAELKMLSK